MAFDLASIFEGGIKGVLGSVSEIIARFKANPDIAAKASADIAVAEAALRQAELDYELKLSLAQTEINKIEAGSSDKFASRWRPAVGWVCCLGLLYATVLAPFMDWIGHNVAGWRQPPTLNVEVLTTTLFAMLGIAGMRSFDKLKGTTQNFPTSTANPK